MATLPRRDLDARPGRWMVVLGFTDIVRPSTRESDVSVPIRSTVICVMS